MKISKNLKQESHRYNAKKVVTGDQDIYATQNALCDSPKADFTQPEQITYFFGHIVETIHIPDILAPNDARGLRKNSIPIKKITEKVNRMTELGI